jgi:dienelactone hydrolase
VLLSARELGARKAAVEVPASGNYTLWVWSKGGEAIAVKVGEQIAGEAKAQAEAGAFGWTQVGAGELKAGTPYKLQLGGDEAATSSALHHTVGYILLTQRADARIDRLFDFTRVFGNEPKAVDDRRLKEFRHIDMKIEHPIAADSKEAWTKRVGEIRKQVLVANGLWPMPERTPLNAKRFGRIDHEDYSIEKVYFESFPGFYATGNLYLPRGKQPPYPAILCPHGHWKNGRLTDEKDGSVVARCISLARQGHVVFSIDMVGYNDSSQIKHSFAGPLWGASLMGLQTWDNTRAIDFLLTVEGVDPQRIGCTGASGGGTQTFILTAIDERVKAAVPVCMVSAHFQGGCECENAPLLRVNLNNVEIAASAVPRPYMITGATGDWTKNIMQVEGPAIERIYDLFGAKDHFHHVIVDAGHNYNQETREHVYRWMGQWLLNEKDAEKLREQPYTVDKREDMLVFTAEHPRPATALDEAGIRDSLAARAKAQLAALAPKDQASLAKFRDVYGPMLACMLDARRPEPGDVDGKAMGNFETDRIAIEKLLISRHGAGDAIPAVLVRPKENAKGAVVLVGGEGKLGALIDLGTMRPNDLARALFEAGYTILAIDPCLTGEYHTPFAETKRALPKGFPYTYNPTTLALRVQDILTAEAYLAKRSGSPKVDLVGMGNAGPWCVLAAAAGLQQGGRVAADLNGFADADEASWQSEMFQPNILAFGGLRTAASLAAPNPLWLHGTRGKLDGQAVAGAYEAAGAKDAVRVSNEAASVEEIVSWLGK